MTLPACAVVSQTGLVILEPLAGSKRLLIEIKEALFLRMDALIKEWHTPDAFISDVLAQSGRLPLFGMPTDARFLYQSNRFEPSEDSPRGISTSLERSISDYAPGAQRTKDKGIYTSIGFTPKLFGDPGWEVL